MIYAVVNAFVSMLPSSIGGYFCATTAFLLTKPEETDSSQE